MRMDFHYHSILTTRAPFDAAMLQRSLATAKNRGLEAICLCEHCGAPAFDDVHRYLSIICPYENDVYQYDGLLLYSAVEVNIAPKGHMVVVSDRTQILTLRHMLLQRYPDTDPLLEQLIQVLCDTGLRTSFLLIGGHPARAGQELYELEKEQLLLLDAIDLNGKDTGRWPRIRHWLQSIPVALPQVTGSDTHYPSSCGNAWTELPGLSAAHKPTLAQVRQELETGQYAVKSSILAPFLSYHAGWKKRRLVASMQKNGELPHQHITAEALV